MHAICKGPAARSPARISITVPGHEPAGQFIRWYLQRRGQKNQERRVDDEALVAKRVMLLNDYMTSYIQVPYMYK